MHPKTRRRGIRYAGLIAFVALPLHAEHLEVQPPATPTTAPSAADSSVDAPPDSTPRMVADSSRTTDLAFVVDSLASAGPAEDAGALAARLRRLTDAADALPFDERLVFDEVVAAAREMLENGDLEASRLLAADAVDVLRRGSP